ncbi:MAG: hypothetical protein VB106_14940 [Clostridiaceae bacterium]|jgi:hypothetical protein|nr:hypothetical protein [Clostridiaceae bacterium]
MVNRKYWEAGIVVLLAVILVLFAVILSAADGVTPGSEQDPIVTQSYVEQKSEQIKYYIDSLIEKINGDNSAQNQEIAKLREELKNAANAAGKFQVVELQKDQILIAGEGAEIIPRSGKFSAVEDAYGGLSDITAARDLKNGEAVVNNHMLIAARGEGRGLKALADKSFLIIKGTYTLQ